MGFMRKSNNQSRGQKNSSLNDSLHQEKKDNHGGMNKLHNFMRTTLSSLLAVGSLSLSLSVYASDMVTLPSGEYRALYSSQASPLEWVKAFKLDITPVTNQEFAEFIEKNPQWSRKNIKPMFAEEDYLKRWVVQGDDYTYKTQEGKSPVTNVSWFAAQAYCRAQGKRLPTIAEWEYVARASDTQVEGSKEKEYTQTILRWYSKAVSEIVPAVKQGHANYWGVYDMHGLIWEWTQDFNATVATTLKKSNKQEVEVDGRTISLDIGAFCGAGSEGVADPSDYAAFMRYGFRSSLKAPFTLETLGFRCAQDID